MAIDFNFARFLISCRHCGVSFRDTITLGRLNSYIGIKETRRLIEWGNLDESRCRKILNYDESRHAEPFFEVLGARTVDSMDASGFEGATVVHDLNLPITEALKGRFDVVCDAGTIEHVMNFPTAIRNCMEMVRVGGHLILGTPANNFFGHGFYQFSPELWFRLFSPAQGFRVIRIVAVEYGPRSRWFEVTDPEMVRERVELTNRYPVLLMVLAEKTAEVALFQTYPQQSDYVPRWKGAGDPSSRRSALEVRLRRGLLETFPRLARFLENVYWSSPLNRKTSLGNRRFYRRVRR